MIVGKIYANWCGHCQALKPEWAKMKQSLHPSIQLVEIEESDTTNLTNFKNEHPDLEVNGYPTIFKIHPTKKIEYYSGNRDASSMLTWANAGIKSDVPKRFRKKGGTRKTKQRKTKHRKTHKKSKM